MVSGLRPWSCRSPGQNPQTSHGEHGKEIRTPRGQAWVDVVYVRESRKISPATSCQK